MEFPIKDRDQKVKKVLCIIADIEEQMKKINPLLPKSVGVEETKGGLDLMNHASSKSTNDNSGNMMSNNQASRQLVG